MNIFDLIKEEISVYDKMADLQYWFENETKKIDSISNYKEWKFKQNVLMKTYLKKKNDLLKKGDDSYELAGNMNSKYIYHYTKEDNLLNILTDNEMVTGENGISFTSHSNLYKRGFVFWYPGKYSEGTHHGNTGVKIKFDFNKMKADGLKFKKGSEDLGTHSGELELRLMEDELHDVNKYIVEIIIFKDKIKNYDILEKIKKLLDLRKIKHKII